MRFSEISSFALDAHFEFNSTVWGRNRPSFHNRYHILAVQKAGQLLVDGTKNGSDPLGIQTNLDKWNRRYPDYRISLSEFGEILPTALALHDLGNICKNLSFNESESPKPIYLEGYKSKDAEKRGADISELLISMSDLNKNDKDKYSRLIQYIIRETTFDAKDIQEPFSQLIRIIDQVGSRIFCQMEKKQIERGLLEEMRLENPHVPLYNPDYFFNFPRRRIHELGLDNTTIEKLTITWMATLPDETSGYSNQPTKIEDIIRVMELT